LAKIALRNDPSAFAISADHPKRAYHYAHPTSHAPFLVTEDRIGGGIPTHGTGQTSLQAGGILTMAALERKGKMSLLLHPYTGLGLGVFPFIGLQDVSGFGILYDAVDLAQSAIHAEFLADEDPFHLTMPLPLA
jgi:hypothetical protein